MFACLELLITSECGRGRTGPRSLQQQDLGVNFFLFSGAETVPPTLKLISEFNFPCHRRNITPVEYDVNGILRVVSIGDLHAIYARVRHLAVNPQ